MQPDIVDWKIINILSKEHIPNSTVAQKLGISEGTVRQRIRKLQTAGILKIKALRAPDVLENQQLAIVAINISEANLLDRKANEIAELENVLSVSIISGRYDMLIEVLVDSNKGLVTFLTESLSEVKGIESTETFVTLRSYNKWI